MYESGRQYDQARPGGTHHSVGHVLVAHVLLSDAVRVRLCMSGGRLDRVKQGRCAQGGTQGGQA